MFKKSKKAFDLLKFLQQQKLPNVNEQSIIEQATVKLHQRENPYLVKADVKSSLTELALKKQLSKEGVQLLTQLSKPNINEDVARASTTWF
ncbi:hypothetical protein OZX58_06100 [Lactobacillus sp. ESL0680]|uniref:hypothetical protein n=1 Tax=Lactobacillus sp. ESL0680 TaxID=2983210 RepID=UPI0023F74161|nr:hypothetical protein [Lactobacillus sp. ESL0680]WEV38303.1 hypothetical protein OZX58_06100 [Lactobacillus sp. ESL0680]